MNLPKFASLNSLRFLESTAALLLFFMAIVRLLVALDITGRPVSSNYRPWHYLFAITYLAISLVWFFGPNIRARMTARRRKLGLEVIGESDMKLIIAYYTLSITFLNQGIANYVKLIEWEPFEPMTTMDIILFSGWLVDAVLFFGAAVFVHNRRRVNGIMVEARSAVVTPAVKDIGVEEISAGGQIDPKGGNS